jgi:hypothetical protein
MSAQPASGAPSPSVNCYQLRKGVVRISGVGPLRQQLKDKVHVGR